MEGSLGLEDITTLNALRSSGVRINNTLFEILRYDSLFSKPREDIRVDKLDTLLLPDVCKYKTNDMLFEVMGQRRHGKSDSVRHYQPPFSEACFAQFLLKSLYLWLYLS
jgi:hypothetical protein